jgi:hypothetical protein
MASTAALFDSFFVAAFHSFLLETGYSTKEHSNYLPLVHLSPQSFYRTKNRIPMAGAKLQNQRESNSKARAEEVHLLCRAQNYFDGTSKLTSKLTRYAR